MSNKFLKMAFAVSAVAALAGAAGCATKPVENADVSTKYNDHQVDKQIAEAADTAAKAQEKLARIEVARTKPSPSQLDENNLPAELKRPATMEWSGPASEAASKVAALIGYDFKITGNRPSVPPMVDVSAKDVPAAKVLEDIGLQAFPFGEVAVDPNAKRIEFRYLQAQQQPATPKGTSPSWGK